MSDISIFLLDDIMENVSVGGIAAYETRMTMKRPIHPSKYRFRGLIDDKIKRNKRKNKRKKPSVTY